MKKIFAFSLGFFTSLAFFGAEAKLPWSVVKVPIMGQATHYSCGAGALNAVLHYWQVFSGYENELYSALELTEKDGTTPQHIVKCAKQFGLEARFKEKTTFQDLENAVKKGQTVIIDYQAWPDDDEAGTSWENTWEAGHYSVVIGVDKKNVYLMDPSVETSYSYIPRTELLARWHDYEDRDGKKWKNYQLAIFIKGKSHIKGFPGPLQPSE